MLEHAMHLLLVFYWFWNILWTFPTPFPLICNLLLSYKLAWMALCIAATWNSYSFPHDDVLHIMEVRCLDNSYTWADRLRNSLQNFIASNIAGGNRYLFLRCMILLTSIFLIAWIQLQQKNKVATGNFSDVRKPTTSAVDHYYLREELIMMLEISEKQNLDISDLTTQCFYEVISCLWKKTESAAEQRIVNRAREDVLKYFITQQYVLLHRNEFHAHMNCLKEWKQLFCMC